MSSVIEQRKVLEDVLQGLSTNLVEAFMQTDPRSFNNEDAGQLLNQYNRHVIRCGLAAGRGGMTDIQDSCVLLQKILESLLVNPSQAIARYHEILEQWPLLVSSSLQTGEADCDFISQLHDLLHATQWPIAIKEDDIPARKTAANPPDVAQEEFGILRQEFSDALAPLLQLHESGNQADAELFHNALADSAARIELFGISAASVGLLGLMDVAQILQAELRSRALTKTPFDTQEWHELLTLNSALLEYLADAVLPESADNLLFAVEQFTLHVQLSESELADLRNLLEVPQATAKQEQPVVGPEIKNLPDERLEENQGEVVRELSVAARELIVLIANELEQAVPELAAHLQAILDSETEQQAREEALEQYAGIVCRFGDVIDSIGMSGLSKLFKGLRNYLQTINGGAQVEAETAMWLAEWPAYVINYLTNPYTQADELAEFCKAQSALLSIAGINDTDFVAELRNPQVNLEDEETEPRQTTATAEDVSLRLPEDVNPQLLDSLLQELPHQTAEFSRVIGNIVQGNGNLQDVDTAQRVAHTLKGSANTVGVAGIANLTHHIEDILLAFAKRKRMPARPLSILLQDAADVLEMMSETLLGQGSVSEQQAVQVLQQILDWANKIDQDGLPEDDESVTAESGSAEPTLTQPPSSVQEDKETSLRVSMQSIDETLRLVGESIIVNSQLQESLRQSLVHNRTIHGQSDLFQQLAFELEQLVDVRGMHSFLAGVSNSRFDSLEMDQYNEMHTLTRRLVEAATDSRELTLVAEDELKNLEALILQQGRINKDTQEVVMKSRMLPVKNLVPRLQRSVRQACRITGKEVHLQISGEETLIDNDILNSLADPLMHILRNAVDHGIETAEQRKLKGKPNGGLINLDFSREGEYIAIRCHDDGAGLDYQAIRQVAVEKGVISDDVSLEQDELARLILLAGVTTRKEITQVSGRGIGMDAVYNQINNMKGTLRIESETGNGTLIELLLPITLITMHGILALTRDQIVAITNRSVEQIIHADAGSVVEEDGQLYYGYESDRYKAFYLEDLLGMMRIEQETHAIKRPALLLNLEAGKKVVVLVEKIITTQDIVIKKLGQYVPRITGIEGATILGDGSIASVIDLTAILAEFQPGAYVPLIERSDLTGIQSGAPKVLVVDDSLSARRSLAEFMQDSGYRVFTARDGIDAIAQLEEEAPDLLLVDMEMPRMNGLELTAYIRANPATHNLPVIMITSRATDKHRVEANKAGVNAYLVKPYSEEEVLATIDRQLTKAFTNQKLIAS